ncbi:MAG: hypothetical protein K0S65_4022, partial [Labilithrix sp.]|nr:hypothetical protein [Labilithrix sp.]
VEVADMDGGALAVDAEASPPPLIGPDSGSNVDPHCSYNAPVVGLCDLCEKGYLIVDGEPTCMCCE